jgi:mannose-6-phosphate isomerase-like protein (cupin superfamily)
MAGDLSPDALLGWIDRYEQVWRADPEGVRLGELFTSDVAYVCEPYAEPLVGLDALRTWWAESSQPGEVFTLDREVVSCSGRTGVARVRVQYGEPSGQEYLDLWVVELDDDDPQLVSRFEEWPFWPTHGRSPLKPAAKVVSPEEIATTRYGEWVRSWALSAGVYRVAAGGVDDQSPHGEDEVYVVTKGAAHLEIDGVRSPVGAGTVAYVPRRLPHRFVDVTEDIEVAVVFAPPEGST